MRGRLTCCHDGPPPSREEPIYFKQFADRLPGLSLHALFGLVKTGRFPPPVNWRGRAGAPAWNRADVERALAVVRVETYDGEPVGAYGDP